MYYYLKKYICIRNNKLLFEVLFLCGVMKMYIEYVIIMKLYDNINIVIKLIMCIFFFCILVLLLYGYRFKNFNIFKIN